MKGGETRDKCKSTPERIAGSTAQALSKEGGQEWDLEHRSAQAVVRIEKRITAHPEEKVDPAL
jgi:hypothetical protein